MAQRFSPYYANEGRYGGVGKAVGNLGQVFADMNDPSAGIATDRAAWDTRKNMEDVTDTTMARSGRGKAAELILSGDPGGDDMRQLFASVIEGGSYTPSETAKLLQAIQGNIKGATDEERAGAYVGGGGTISPDDAFSIDGRNEVAGRNAGYAQELEALKGANSQAETMMGKRFDLNNPTGRDDTVGSVFRSQGAEAGNEAYRAMYGTGSGGTGAGVGAGGGPVGVTPDQGRFLDAQGKIREELSAMLASYGVPVDKKGNTRVGLLPQGYYENVLQQATDMASQDNFSRGVSFYVEKALKNQEQMPGGYTEDNSIWPGFGGEELKMKSNSPSPPAGGQTVVTTDAEYDALPPGTMFVDETGKGFHKPCGEY